MQATISVAGPATADAALAALFAGPPASFLRLRRWLRQNQKTNPTKAKIKAYFIGCLSEPNQVRAKMTSSTNREPA